MKELFLLSVFMIVVFLNAFSQTGRIAHRSHSGKNSVSRIQSTDNFGLPSDDDKKKKKTSAPAKPKKDADKAALPRAKDRKLEKTPSTVK